jgi:GntR family transcriptional regulator
MLDAESSKPLYEQIKEYILHKITTGELPPHARIPSERMLAQQFGINRLTASKAIKELVLDGKLYTRVGKGTYVKEEPIDHTLGSLTSFTEEMSARGQPASSRVLRAGITEAYETVARLLNVTVGTPLVILKRVRLANQQPIALETSTIVAAYCEGILEHHDFARESLYRVLREEYDLCLTQAEQVFEARQATEDETEILELEASSPILAITRVTYLDNGDIVECVESAYRGDRYKFRAMLLNM